MALNALEVKTFSTGELARLCSVTKHTIISAIDRNELKSSRTPGGHHRISQRDASEFLRKHDVVTQATPRLNIILISNEEVIFNLIEEIFVNDGAITHSVNCTYKAGVMIERLQPALVIVDHNIDCEAVKKIINHIDEPDYQVKTLTVLLVDREDKSRVQLFKNNRNVHFLEKPFPIHKLQEVRQAVFTN